MNTTFVHEKSNRIIYGMRVQMNCSQAEFGRKIGLSQPEMSGIESGKKPVTEKIVSRIADRFNIDPECIRGNKPMNWASL